MLVDRIIIRCKTVTWLRNRAEECITTFDTINFKMYISRLERELDELMDDLVILINSSEFDTLESNFKEQIWELFNEISRELGFP
jgi:hypothetical protein